MFLLGVDTSISYNLNGIFQISVKFGLLKDQAIPTNSKFGNVLWLLNAIELRKTLEDFETSHIYVYIFCWVETKKLIYPF